MLTQGVSGYKEDDKEGRGEYILFIRVYIVKVLHIEFLDKVFFIVRYIGHEKYVLIFVSMGIQRRKGVS